jgi:hypothetical protein
MATPAPATFAQLLEHAVNEPGILSNAYRQFHGYSIGNQLLALSQCLGRGIQPGPIATFQRWKELGRYVRRGEKAITLCRPVTVKRTTTSDDGTEDTTAATWFVYQPQWFVLAQTEGQPVAEPITPTWNKDRALATLDVQEMTFDLLDGNCLGFARQRSIAVNPVNPLPHKTRFHELAHVMLGHTSEGTMNDGELHAAQSARSGSGVSSPALPRRAESAGCRVLTRLHSGLVGRAQPDTGEVGTAHFESG